MAWSSTSIAIADTVKGEAPGEILHLPAAGQEGLLATLAPGERLALKLDGAAFHVVAFGKAGFVCESAAVDYDSIVVVEKRPKSPPAAQLTGKMSFLLLDE